VLQHIAQQFCSSMGWDSQLFPVASTLGRENVFLTALAEC
jgi:hypothetical protein